MKNWEDYHLEQFKVCEKHDSKLSSFDQTVIIGVSANLTGDPIHGLRHLPVKGTSGWYIWTGEYSEDEDFFQPLCAEHLLNSRPEIIKYLALEPGFRFLSASNGYEDVWFEERLLIQ